MKQSAAKTLGVAVVGAAFAAVAAGSASAATVPAAAPNVSGALDSVAEALPVQVGPAQLPLGAGKSVDAGRTALGSESASLPNALAGTLSKGLPLNGGANPGGLLGGLPSGSLSGNSLPGDALSGIGA
ncbi:ATP-binding protein [Streptomyces sp. NPDC051322]|uniref:ATP-binding protein n=1 Tax=Streptomyces sp. NPDC051322 TaxID=3154645 RepID=UPI0034507F72